MVNYNDGKWHGWNGGECPVHPESAVIVKWSCNGVETNADSARKFEPHWAGREICSFRVVEEYAPKPREWWIVPGSNVALCCAGSLTPRPHPNAVLVREVLDGNGCAPAS